MCTHPFIPLFLKTTCLFIYGCTGLGGCTWALSSCGEEGLFFVVVWGLLILVAPLVAEHGL